MQLQIEDDCLHVEKRTFPAKDGKPSRDTFKQKGYMRVTGSRYPKEVFIPRENEKPLELGKYVLHDESFRIGQYGDIQINPFQQTWLMVEDSKGKPVGQQ